MLQHRPIAAAVVMVENLIKQLRRRRNYQEDGVSGCLVARWPRHRRLNPRRFGKRR